MIQIETKVRLPILWGRQAFQKKNWAQINLIVGPNGSGKTLLASGLAEQFSAAGHQVEFLRSERMEQESHLKKLREDSAIRQKVEMVLSNMFGKSIRFEERSDGSVVPFVTNTERGIEYGLRNEECHGLKEILTLLVALYGSTSGCLILDEPELHLHPQLQLFFINEMRKVAAQNKRRMFFLITHSPFFIDLRIPEDLIGVVVCHSNRAPTHIETLGDEDEAMFRRFLPRFNTYHKQFFFSDNQIFVEGYTDQQMFASLLDCIENPQDSAGTGIIDVGGKDELGVFFKVCSLLGTDGRIITDLDSMFCGKLRDVVCADTRPARWLEKQREKQLPFYRSVFTQKEVKQEITLARLIQKEEAMLSAVGKTVCEIDGRFSGEVQRFVEKVRELHEKHENAEALDTFKTIILQGVIRLDRTLADILPVPVAATLPLIKNLANLILAAAEAARVYILPCGCIEHYYTQNNVEYMPVPAKDRLFHTELEHIIAANPQELREEYAELVHILRRACMKYPA